MKILLKMILVVSTVLLVGCGGGGSSENGSKNPTEETSSYINKKLPVIQENSIPDSLLDGKSSKSKKIKKQYKEVGEQSSGYAQLKEKAAFFYKKQLQMNMELGYMDSIWEQIESYCHGKDICNVPSGKILFTYTNALYKRDIALITKYEEKTGIEYQNNGILKEDLKTIIGQSAKLSSARLITDDEAEYTYVLSTEQLGDQEENPNLERSIVKWNDNNQNYFIREEVEGTIDGKSSGNPDWTQYEYREIGEEKVNIFVSKDNFLGYNNEHLEFREKDGEVRFIQDEPGENELESYYADGELSSTGGSMTVVGAGESTYEKFDREGNIITTIDCMSGNNTDRNNLEECSIRGNQAIKEIIVNNTYAIGPFRMTTDINAMQDHSTVFFNEDNTLEAIVNCSTFKAKYVIDNKGIWFSEIQKDKNNTLICLSNKLENNFNNFLNEGYSFAESGYVVWNGLMADLVTVGEKSKFDKKAFLSKLTENRYVDSHTMNNLFKIKGWDGFFNNPEKNKEYFLSSPTSMKIENDKIYIELIDASFEAEISVIDNDKIEFTNVKKTKKDNVVYPVRNCTDESGENECIDGYDANVQYEDKIFTQVMEEFLKNSVLVSNEGVSDNGVLWFHNDKISFHGNY